ncbi:MAG: T9SS type A sorting domain-containing protein [Saprospiraceae bacterium]|nr:T9SS type A sorting domain-containing protein [Saprospiraceae bacterium]
MKHTYLPLVLFCFLSQSLLGQFGISLNSPEALQSYTLFETRFNTHLIDNCGEIVNTWENAFRIDLHPKLLPNGNLIFIKNNAVFELDWDDNVVQETRHNISDLMLDYEVIVLPNGNYLCVARRIRSSFFFTTQGYNPSLGRPEYDDAIVEIVPGTGEVVWEWTISDHIIQERNPSLANYGKIDENPQLLNLDAISTFDWEFGESFMINGMDYNADLDQIVLSVRKINEIVIIDHSTTTAEAKGSTGGRYGKGGDILYRFGNPQNYLPGVSADRILYFQHNPNWIKYGEHKGKIIIHNNGLNRPGVNFSDLYSSLEIIDPLMDENGNYELVGGFTFSPLEPNFSYNRITTGTYFYSGYTSSARVLSNGNIYITEGVNDRFLEINPEGEVVWEYTNQFGSYIFRSEKYPMDYPAFNNKTLIPNGTVEEPSSPYDCKLYTTSTAEQIPVALKMSVKVLNDKLVVDLPSNELFNLDVFDMMGRKVTTKNSIRLVDYDLSIENLNSGIYIVSVYNQKQQTTEKIFIN